MRKSYDLVVVGAGPGGTRAAFVAAAAGLKTAVVEAGFLGGTCLNAGCIPTKYLLGGTAFLPLLRAQEQFGVAAGRTEIDLPALQARKEHFLKGSRLELEKRLATAGVTPVRGRATFSGPRQLQVKGPDAGEIDFGKCILATGSTPAAFPGLKADGAAVLAPAGALNLKKTPQSLIIVGGGAIGLELGEFFHRLGCAVHLVEGMPRILPGEDEEISGFMEKYLTREGWTIHTGRKIADLRTRDDRAVLTFEDGETLEASRAMPAVGRRPGLAAPAVEAAGLGLDARGWLKTDDFLMASPDVYVVGDANGRTLLASAADHQGEYAARHAAGLTKAPYAAPAMPLCIYGGMELMRVGPTLRELRAAGEEVRVSRVQAATCPLLQASGHIQGFFRAAWTNGRLRSLVAVCRDASHLGGAAALLLEHGYRRDESAPIIFAHPTLDEGLRNVLESPEEAV